MRGLTDVAADSGDPFLRRPGANVALSRLRRIASPEGVSKKLYVFFWYSVDLGLAVINLKLQLAHDLANPPQSFGGSSSTTDHKIISKVDDVRFETLHDCLTQKTSDAPKVVFTGLLCTF